LLAVSARDSLIRIWAVPSGRLVATLKGHKRANIMLSFNSDGRTLASMANDNDGTVKLWNIATGRELFSLTIPTDDTEDNHVAFSPDGRSLAALHRDGLSPRTRLWFAPSWAEIAVVEGKDYRSLAQDAGTWFAVGQALEKRGRLEEANEAFGQAVQRASNHTDLEGFQTSALHHRAKLFAKLGRLSEAAAANLAALNLPLRNSSEPAQSIDLSAYFNRTLDVNSLGISIPREAFLNDFPRGIQELPGAPGIQFDIRAIAQLKNDPDPDYYPGLSDMIEGVVVRRKAHRIHFLHGTHNAEKPGTQIASYVLHYSDGKQESVPMVYGRDVYDFSSARASEDDPQGPKPVWKGKSGNRVYVTTWQNPRPEMEIASLDFVSSLNKCEPFLIAITTEP